MGKLKGQKIPRKLKKEFCKIDCWEVLPPVWNMTGNGITVNERLRLKKGSKINKWTMRLSNMMKREKQRQLCAFHQKEVERLMAWHRKGVYPINNYEERLRSKSPEEFRREYLNEPIFEPKYHSMDAFHKPVDDAIIAGHPEIMGRYSRVSVRDNDKNPGFVIIDDMDEVMPNVRTKQEELEWIERTKLWYSSMIQPDINGEAFAPKAILKLKEGAITPDKVEEFKELWKEQMRKGTIMTMPEGATVEFITPKIKHKLHNHPKAEMELCAEDEVIVDVEFMKLFCWYRPLIDKKNGHYDTEHVIVRKNEYLAQIEGARERERPAELF